MAKGKRKPISKKALVVIVALILAAVVALTVIYFTAPAVWNKIADFFTAESRGGEGKGELAKGDGELQIHYIDVGQGDCILILFPDGKDMIIDCGSMGAESIWTDSVSGYISDYVEDGRLDYLMLTHCDNDHVKFMKRILADYQVDNIFMPFVRASSPKDAARQAAIDALPTEKLGLFTDEDTIDTNVYADFFIAALSEPDCLITPNVDPDENDNQVIIEEENYRFTFYCPTLEYYSNTGFSSSGGFGEAERKNAISPIGILEYNGFKLVFTGDSNEVNEPQFTARAGNTDCDVLKVGHHGSETSSTARFLDSVSCEYAIISCNAKGNTFRHPRQTTLDRFAARGMSVYRTDNNGTIVLSVTTTLKFSVQKESSFAENLIGLS